MLPERDLPRCTQKELCPRIERAPEGLFEGEEAVVHLIERIVDPLGIRVDESSPWADARLPDGSRVQTNFLCASFSSVATRDLRFHYDRLPTLPRARWSGSSKGEAMGEETTSPRSGRSGRAASSGRGHDHEGKP